MKSSTASLPSLRSVKVLDQRRERIRYLHCSLRTEQAHVHWVRAFLRLHGLCHPATLGGSDVEAFLSWLANERKVAGSESFPAFPCPRPVRLGAFLVRFLSGPPNAGFVPSAPNAAAPVLHPLGFVGGLVSSLRCRPDSAWSVLARLRSAMSPACRSCPHFFFAAAHAASATRTCLGTSFSS